MGLATCEIGHPPVCYESKEVCPVCKAIDKYRDASTELDDENLALKEESDRLKAQIEDLSDQIEALRRE